MGETRKLAAILVADVVGYSRLAAADEDRTLARLRGLRSDLIDPAITAHHWDIVKRTGDGLIAEFRSVVDAVRCAIEVQNGMVERNAGVPEDRRIEFRIGVHLGDVVEEADGDLMATASISPRVWKASPSPVRSVSPRTPIVMSRDGLIWRSPTWAKLSSRTKSLRGCPMSCQGVPRGVVLPGYPIEPIEKNSAKSVPHRLSGVALNPHPCAIIRVIRMRTGAEQWDVKKQGSCSPTVRCNAPRSGERR
jgi:hypothetical protein